MTPAVGIYMFDDVEVLDFAGPFEVFSTAARLAARQQADRPPLAPMLIAIRARPCTRGAGCRSSAARRSGRTRRSTC